MQNSESYLQITPEVITGRFYKICAENMTYSGNILIKSWTENFKFHAVTEVDFTCYNCAFITVQFLYIVLFFKVTQRKAFLTIYSVIREEESYCLQKCKLIIITLCERSLETRERRK